MTKSKYWLVRYEIRDGENEYDNYLTVKTSTIEGAEKIANKNKSNFILPQDYREIKISRIGEISKKDASVLYSLIGVWIEDN